MRDLLRDMVSDRVCILLRMYFYSTLLRIFLWNLFAEVKIFQIQTQQWAIVPITWRTGKHRTVNTMRFVCEVGCAQVLMCS